MIRNKKLIIRILLIILILSSSIGIAYAALQKTLNISFGTVKSQNLNFDIGIDPNNKIVASKVNNSGYVYCSDAVATKTTLSGIDVKLYQTFDTCKYPFTIKNRGSLTGKISKINITSPQGTPKECTKSANKMVCDNIEYSVENTSGADLLVGQTFEAGTGFYAYLIVQSTSNKSTVSNVDHSEQTGFSFNIEFEPA